MTPSPSPSQSPESPHDLPGAGSLPAGQYTRFGFKPPVLFEVNEDWAVGSAADGFFDVQQRQGTRDVIAVQFAIVEGVVGADAKLTTSKSADQAADVIHRNPGVTVIDESESHIGGLVGSNVVVENRSAAHSTVLRVAAGDLGIDPKRRLWISLFDTNDGILAIMVGGSVATWDQALTAAEPVLESVQIFQAAGTPEPTSS